MIVCKRIEPICWPVVVSIDHGEMAFLSSHINVLILKIAPFTSVKKYFKIPNMLGAESVVHTLNPKTTDILKSPLLG